MIRVWPHDTVVHVNRGQIDSNRKARQADAQAPMKPVLKAQKGKTGKGEYGDQIDVLDAQGEVVASFVYDPDGILACGAKVVLIAHHGVKVR